MKIQGIFCADLRACSGPIQTSTASLQSYGAQDHTGSKDAIVLHPGARPVSSSLQQSSTCPPETLHLRASQASAPSVLGVPGKQFTCMLSYAPSYSRSL